MRKIEIINGYLNWVSETYKDKEKIDCPLSFAGEFEATCSTNCAWFRVYENYLAYCGDKLIGEIKEE